MELDMTGVEPDGVESTAQKGMNDRHDKGACTLAPRVQAQARLRDNA